MAPKRRSNAVLDDPEMLGDAYRAAGSIADLADRVGLSSATVRRALVRYGIARLPRNRGRRPEAAAVLDDPNWLADRYRLRTGVEIANELGVSSTTVYAAMRRHGIDRRSSSSTLPLRTPELFDADWLADVIEQGSSVHVANRLGVSPGTVTTAYRRVGIDPASTTRLFARGRRRPRPAAVELRSVWVVEGTFRGVGQRFGIAHSTAAVWLAEIGVFADSEPALGRSTLVDAVAEMWPMKRIAAAHGVAVTTVRVELHRHGLFEDHRNRHRSRASGLGD